MSDEFAKDLQAALGTRPVIEQAKGVLIGLRGDTPEQAFAELRHASQTHNVKLHVLASALVDAVGGRRVTDLALEHALLNEWGNLLTRYPVIETVGEQEPA
jgi:ANTAR domain